MVAPPPQEPVTPPRLEDDHRAATPTVAATPVMRSVLEHPSAGAWPTMVAALRGLLDSITAAAPPLSVTQQLTAELSTISRRLAPFAVPENEQLTGRLGSPGRGQVMSPQLHIDSWGPDQMIGRVTFGRHYLGGNGAVHGGAIPLLFDEALGRLANAGDRAMSRTAYLHVNFRHVTPVGRELTITGRFDREEGRKRLLVGSLYDEDTLCADAEGLFVALLPGMP